MYADGESCTNVNVNTLAPNYKSGFRETLYSIEKLDVTGYSAICPNTSGSVPRLGQKT
jgi:hypothetical protein